MNQIRDLLLFGRGLDRMEGLHEADRSRWWIGKVMLDEKPPARLRWEKCVPVRETCRVLLLAERLQQSESILERRQIESILFENRPQVCFDLREIQALQISPIFREAFRR